MIVSIIMPAYNSSKTISRAIESVLSQSYELFQLIIIDDNSNDTTSIIVGLYLKDKRITFIN